MDELAIELGKANKFSDIAHNLRRRPRLEELVLGLRRPISVGADIVPHKLKSLGEDEAFLEA
jgi:hypothetical protein